MTPFQLAKTSESSQQRAVFCWVAMAVLHGFAAADDEQCYKVPGYALERFGTAYAVPCLALLFHIPNGGARGDNARSNAIRGAAMKAEGVKAGVYDLFLPVARGGWHGLFIEMKKPGEKIKKKSDQEQFGFDVQAQGFGACECDSWRQCVNVLKQYINYEQTNKA
jgi:hypothetical protein